MTMKKVFLAALISTALFSCSEPKASINENVVTDSSAVVTCDTNTVDTTAVSTATTTATVTATVEVKK